MIGFLFGILAGFLLMYIYVKIDIDDILEFVKDKIKNYQIKHSNWTEIAKNFYKSNYVNTRRLKCKTCGAEYLFDDYTDPRNIECQNCMKQKVIK